MPKFFVDSSDISLEEVIITGENLHHLSHVLRHKVDDEIIVCDGNGFDYLCVIKKISKDNAMLEVIKKYKSPGEPEIKISLFQGVPKGDKLSLIVEKCVEAGAYEITPVNMDRCVSKLSKKDFSKKKERLYKVSSSASKQCGRGIIPKINELIDLDEFLIKKSEYDLVLFPYEDELGNTLKSEIKDFKGKSIAVIIGPEGGFSKEEAKKLKDMGIPSVTLGKRILRTETASMAAIFNILYELEL